MQRTPEQIAADNALQDAVAVAMHAYDIVDEGQLIAQWAIAFYLAGVDDEGDETGTYGAMYPNGTLPSFMAIGLFTKAINTLESQ